MSLDCENSHMLSFAPGAPLDNRPSAICQPIDTLSRPSNYKLHFTVQQHYPAPEGSKSKPIDQANNEFLLRLRKQAVRDKDGAMNRR